MMNYYILQVETGVEARFSTLLRDWAESTGSEAPTFRLLWPRRTLTVRRRGRTRTTQAPLFPGYLVLESESVSESLYRRLRNVSGFVRFLRSNRDIAALEGRQLETLRHFLSFGEVVDQSTVTFDVNNRISVSEGPLKGLEGRIVKVDRRKGRAKVKLDLYEDSFLVDLGFRVLENARGE